MAQSRLHKERRVVQINCGLRNLEYSAFIFSNETLRQQAAGVVSTTAQKVNLAISLGRRRQRRRCNLFYPSGTIYNDHANSEIKQFGILVLETLPTIARDERWVVEQ